MNIKLSKVIGLSLLIFTAEQTFAYPSKVGFDCKQEQHGLFAATREGKNNILQLYLDNKCPLNINDGRGFTLYDIASLAGKKETVQWLIDHNLAKEGQYSSSLYKLIQTGLRFLNHDAGVVDGRMNAATADGIKSFQKFIRQSPTGRPNITWLPIFDHLLTKKMQSKLNELGFKAGSSDGIIGSGTRSAMQAFRQERKMPRGEYPYIDDQLIYQLMMAENEANKKAIARRDAERQARQIAQQAAQRQEEARLRAEAQRRATEKRKLAEAAAAKAEAERVAQNRKAAEEAARVAKERQQAETAASRKAADEAATQALQAQIAQQQAEERQRAVQQQAAAEAARAAEERQQAETAASKKAADEAATQALQAKVAQQQAEERQRAIQQAAAERIARNQREADEAAAREKARQLEVQRLASQQAEAQRVAQQKAAEAERKRLEKIEQEKEAARKREAEMIAARARKAAEEARKAEELARKQAEEAAKAAEKARSEARTAFRDAEKGKPVFALNSSKNVISPKEEKKAPVINGQRTRTPGFQKVAGRLHLQGKGRHLTSCSIDGTALDVGWCHQYFPSGNGKRCQAVISNTGVVVSLTCK